MRILLDEETESPLRETEECRPGSLEEYPDHQIPGQTVLTNQGQTEAHSSVDCCQDLYREPDNITSRPAQVHPPHLKSFTLSARTPVTGGTRMSRTQMMMLVWVTWERVKPRLTM